MGYVTWPSPFRGHFVVRRLGLAMFRAHIKFDYDYGQRRNEGQRQNVKILVLSYSLWDLCVTHRVHLWLDAKRVVDFLLVLIEFFSSQLSRLRQY